MLNQTEQIILILTRSKSYDFKTKHYTLIKCFILLILVLNFWLNKYTVSLQHYNKYHLCFQENYHNIYDLRIICTF